MDNKIKAERGIEKIVKSLPRDLHCENAINELYVRQALISQAEKHHQQLQKAREEERERIFEAIDDFFISPNIVLDGGVLKGYIREAIHSELDQDVSK